MDSWTVEEEKKLSPKTEQEGMRAYEQVCAFEALRRRRIPAIYSGVALLLVVAGFVLLVKDEPRWAVVCLVTVAGFSAVAWWNWRALSRRYAKNLEMIEELERTYGEALPWVAVEKHFAALEQLKRDLEEERRRGEG